MTEFVDDARGDVGDADQRRANGHDTEVERDLREILAAGDGSFERGALAVAMTLATTVPGHDLAQRLALAAQLDAQRVGDVRRLGWVGALEWARALVAEVEREFRRDEGESTDWTESPEDGGRLDRALRPLDSFRPDKARFLWRPYLPTGNITLVGGDYGVGTTWLLGAVMSAGSRGWALPDGRSGRLAATGDAFASLYLSVENDPETVRFRIDRLGGDPSKITVWDTRAEPLPSLEDLSLLDAAIARTRARFVGIDPIQSALGHKVDIHRSNEVRALLDRLSAVARRHDCAMVARIHLNKASTLQVKHRLMGSIDFAAAARSILVAAPMPDEPRRRALVHLKSSLAREGVSLGYSIEGDDETVEFAWGDGPIEIDLDNALHAPQSNHTDTKVGAACQFLREILGEGERTYEHVIAEAEKRGLSESAVKRAGSIIGVRKATFGFPKRSTWALNGVSA